MHAQCIAMKWSINKRGFCFNSNILFYYFVRSNFNVLGRSRSHFRLANVWNYAFIGRKRLKWINEWIMNIESNECKSIPLAIRFEIQKLRQHVLRSNLVDLNELCDAEFKHYLNWKRQSNPIKISAQSDNVKKTSGDRSFGVITLFIATVLCLTIALFNFNIAEYFMSIRCFVPNNYMIWEATRPISNCQFCAGVDRPLILPNISQMEFLVSNFPRVFNFLSITIFLHSNFKFLFCLCSNMHIYHNR